MHQFRFHFHFGIGAGLPGRDAGWSRFRRRRRRKGTPFWLSGNEPPASSTCAAHGAHPLALSMRGSQMVRKDTTNWRE